MITLSEPDLRHEHHLVAESLKAGRLTTGPYGNQVRLQLACDHNAAGCVLVANGTRALVVALRAAWEFDRSMYVIVPVMAWSAVYWAPRSQGHHPMFVDIDPDTLGIDWAKAPMDADAAILVHQYGLPARLPPKAWNGLLIEDCAEAPYARINDRRVGSFGTFATWSFYGNKIFTCGEGGAVVGPNQAELNVAAGYEERDRNGWNERMSELHAAVLCAQLQSRKSILERRQAIWEWYDQNLPATIRFQRLVWQQPSPWLYPVKLPTAGLRRQAEYRLTQASIQYRRFFTPTRLDPSRFPVACDMFRRGLVLPCHHKLTVDDLERIAETLLK